MNNLFKNYRARIVKEGIIKSLLLGLIVGLSLLAVCAFFSWFFGFKAGLWIALALFVAGTAAATPVFYFLKFRPTTKLVAQRIDELGLEERVLTMTELEGQDSYIAKIQREDTERALGKVNHMLIKIAVSAALVIAVCSVAFVGVGATTVDALYNAGVIGSGLHIIEEARPKDKFVLSYSVRKGCAGILVYADGEEEQEGTDLITAEIAVGESGPAVYAVAADNWAFVGWSDGVTTPYRCDVNVNGDVKAEAIFREVVDEPFYDDDQLIQDNKDQQQTPGQQKPGEDKPTDPSDQAPSDPNGDPSDGSSGGNAETDMIVDNATRYGDRYSEDRQNAMDRVDQDSSMDSDLKDGIEDYFDSIEKGNSDNNNNP